MAVRMINIGHILALGLLAAAAACGQPSETKPTAPVVTDKATIAANLNVDGLFVLAPLGGRDTTMGGAEISVSGPLSYDLVAARSQAARTIELHTHESQDGVMQMRQVERFTISQDAPLLMGQGGPHLMVFGFDTTLSPGDEIDLVLDFEVPLPDNTTELLQIQYKAKVHDFSAVGRGS